MLFDWNAVAAPGQVQDVQPCAPLTLTGDGLWVCLVSSGRCTASVPSAGPLPAGAALLLPPQSVPAGHLVLSRAPLVLEPEGSCHLLCVQLTGQASAQFLAGLHELPFLARGETCPAAAELLDRLASEQDLPGRVRSQLAFALLCELADADSAAPALPPLVQAAIADIRANYAGLYGVEELSERLGVSKSHLVRTFTAAVGVPPGKYLTTVRIEAAQRLLLRETGSASRDFLDRIFTSHRVVAVPAMTSVGNSALIAACAVGFGVTVLPESLVSADIAACRLREIKITDADLSRDHFLILHKNKRLNAVQEDIFNICRGI